MALSAKTIDFLMENKLHNSREWFHENKKRYEAEVKGPMYELAAEVGARLLAVDPEFVTEPRRMLCRINRDLRFTKDQSLYRDHLWFNIMRRHERSSPMPCMYVDVGPQGFSYGCGFYSADTKTMAALREMVAEQHPSFKKAKRAARTAQHIFTMEGDCYKRNPYAGHPEEDWLRRRNIYFTCGGKEPELLFADDFAATIADHLALLGPVYHLFLEAMQRAHAGEEK